MSNYNSVVLNIISEADVLLEVLDPRLVELSRNKYLENKVLEKGKTLIFVINKADISKRNQIKNQVKDLNPVFIVSAKTGENMTPLKKFIISKAKEIIEKENRAVLVGVFGYPNTGKSSLLNSLSKGGKVLTSPSSGFTKGKQLLKMRKNIYLIDSPGVIKFNEKDEVRLALLGSKDVNKLKDIEGVALTLIELIKDAIKEHYELKSDDSLDILEEIGQKFNYKVKGNEIDVMRAAKKVISDWQKGLIQPDSNALSTIKHKLSA